MIWYLHNKCPNFQTPGLKAQSHFNLIPGLKAGAPTPAPQAAQWDIIDAGINKYPSTEQGFQRTQEPAFLNARTNDAPGIREMEEFDITNLAAPNADRGNPRTWRRVLCAPVGEPGFGRLGISFLQLQKSRSHLVNESRPETPSPQGLKPTILLPFGTA